MHISSQSYGLTKPLPKGGGEGSTTQPKALPNGQTRDSVSIDSTARREKGLSQPLRETEYNATLAALHNKARKRDLASPQKSGKEKGERFSNRLWKTFLGGRRERNLSLIVPGTLEKKRRP